MTTEAPEDILRKLVAAGGFDSVTHLAQCAGVPRPALYRALKVHRMQQRTAEKIARALGLSVAAVRIIFGEVAP